MKRTEAMLATTADTAQRYIESDVWWAQQKIDGHRCLMHIDGGKIVPVSRSGMDLPVKPYLFNAFRWFVESDIRWVFDAEYLDGQLYIFDMIEAGDVINHRTPYRERVDTLINFWEQIGWPRNSFGPVQLVPVARTVSGKEALYRHVQEIGGEGLMFRHVDSIYAPGVRSHSLLKFKFRNEIDCIVVRTGTDGKANLTLGLVRDGHIVEVGECTALAGDGPKCKTGDVVTVLCHGSSKNNRVVQPTLPRIRTDKLPSECDFSQLDDIRITKTVLTTLKGQ